MTPRKKPGSEHSYTADAAAVLTALRNARALLVGLADSYVLAGRSGAATNVRQVVRELEAAIPLAKGLVVNAFMVAAPGRDQ